MGVFYCIVVLTILGALLITYYLDRKDRKAMEALQKDRDKKVISLCDYLMSEPNNESEANKDDSLH